MKIIIGIDTGTNTGIGYKDSAGGKACFSLPIHKAMDWVRSKNKAYENVFVRVEDARKRKWFGGNSRAKAQGAGSVKRDCRIWEDFLKDEGIKFEMVHPIRGGTKIKAKLFKKITGIETRTNQDARDAYMLITEYKNKENGKEYNTKKNNRAKT